MVFAKAVLVRKILARVLAERVELGQFDRATAPGIRQRSIFFEAPSRLLGIMPRQRRDKVDAMETAANCPDHR